jgi:hypothetical protein
LALDFFLVRLSLHQLWIPQLKLRDCRKGRSRSYFTTDSQPANMSWYPAPLWDLRPDIISCRNVTVWNLRSCIYGAPSLTRGRVCNFQYNHSMVRVAQNPKPYFTISSENPPAWRAWFPYLYLPGTGWPSYTPGHWVCGKGNVVLLLKYWSDLGTRWKWVVWLMHPLLYTRWKCPRYPLDKRLGGPQSRSGCYGEKQNILPPRRIEPRTSSL